MSRGGSVLSVALGPHRDARRRNRANPTSSEYPVTVFEPAEEIRKERHDATGSAALCAGLPNRQMLLPSIKALIGSTASRSTVGRSRCGELARKVWSDSPEIQSTFCEMVRSKMLSFLVDEHRALCTCGWLSESAQRWRSEKSWHGPCVHLSRSLQSNAWWQTMAGWQAVSIGIGRHREMPPYPDLRGMAFRQTWPLGSTPKRHTIGQFQTAGFR